MENSLASKMGQVQQVGVLCVFSSRYPAVPGVRSALRRHRPRICAQPPRRGRAGGWGGRSAHEAPAEPRAVSGSGCHLLAAHPPLRAGDTRFVPRGSAVLRAQPAPLPDGRSAVSLETFPCDEALKKARSVSLLLHRRWFSAPRRSPKSGTLTARNLFAL